SPSDSGLPRRGGLPPAERAEPPRVPGAALAVRPVRLQRCHETIRQRHRRVSRDAPDGHEALRGGPRMATGSGSKRGGVLQPSYLPWLGYFDQLYKSEVFVLYDDVQYDKHGWRNRNRIKTDKGPLWVTVPVLTHGQGLPTNRDARIDTRQPWARKHLQALRVNYAKAAAFALVFDALEPVLRRPWTHLIDLNRAVLEALCRLLGLTRSILLSSELEVPGQKTERLVAL